MIPTIGEDGKRLWQCSDCSYCVRETTRLQKHIESNHIVIEQLCKLCNIVLVSKPAFDTHMRRRHGVKKGEEALF